MEQFPLASFIELVATDRSIAALDDQRIKLQNANTQFEQDIAYKASELARLRDAVVQHKKMVDQKELDVKVLDAKLAAKKKALDMITNQKEYRSIQLEIDTVHTQQMQLEQEVVQAWQMLEHAQQELQVKQVSIEGVVKELQAKIKQITADSAKLETEQQALENTRLEQVNHVPAEWLERYKSMRAQISNPIVPVVNDSCSGCFHHLTQQDKINIRRRVLLQCKGCFRFLYDQELAKQHEGQSVA